MDYTHSNAIAGLLILACPILYVDM
ncbi:uncharacterized protein METZ01_LOCUS73608 [marine metagenome]|uniref:Uncharacterized protein n=1 Tax=marine metagenome TaxID=408172 RepID=A0A381TY48_9ZZZZ